MNRIEISGGIAGRGSSHHVGGDVMRDFLSCLLHNLLSFLQSAFPNQILAKRSSSGRIALDCCFESMQGTSNRIRK